MPRVTDERRRRGDESPWSTVQTSFWLTGLFLFLALVVCVCSPFVFLNRQAIRLRKSASYLFVRRHIVWGREALRRKIAC